MASAKKLPSGNWRVRVTYTDEYGIQKCESFTEKSKVKAELLAKEFQVNMERAKAPENITLGEAMDAYIDNRSAVFSPPTVRGYRQIRKNRLKGIIDTKLSLLTSEKIQKAINEDAKKLKPKTIRNTFGLLAPVLAQYLPDKKFNISLPEKIAYESEIPEDEDFVRLLEEASGTMMIAAILLSACLGLRRSELCALVWEDFDHEKSTVRINKAMVLNDKNEWIVKNSTKTVSSTRGLSIPRVVLDIIHLLPRESIRVIPITPNAVTDRFIRLRNRVGLKVRLHDLRHYNASVMHALNVPDKYAMKRGGWSTPHVMKRVYQHTMNKKSMAVDESINNFFDTLLEDKVPTN